MSERPPDSAPPARPSAERLAALARARDGRVDPASDAAAREAFVQRMVRERRTPSVRRPAWLLAAAALVAVCALVVLVWPSSALEYEIAGGAGDDRYVQTAAEPAVISFADGTSFSVGRESAARVVEVNASGARVLLEHGEVEARVVPLDGAAWSLVAGPYAITVTGTQFTTSWQPEAQRFEVRLVSGSITVKGPMVEPGLAMTAGQRLVANVNNKDVQLSALTAAGVPEPEPTLSTAPREAPTDAGVAPATEPGAAPSTTPSTTPSTAASAAAAPEAPSWSKLIAEGKYTEVMRLARGVGVGTVLDSGSLDQLVALGDAARYTGDGGLSGEVLVALRKRFPESGAAKTAAFLLGRMAEGGSPGTALAWYDRYLSESAGGPYAAEALGRKMMLLARSQPSQARVVAEQYLKLYPKGGYANVAHELTTR